MLIESAKKKNINLRRKVKFLILSFSITRAKRKNCESTGLTNFGKVI